METRSMENKKFLVIQHTDTTTPGNTLCWMKSNGISFQIVKLHKGDELPVVTEGLNIILCGGGIHVDQDHLYPWLKTERKFLEESLRQGAKVVGLCLGGQLMAQILGAKVGPHERGWEVGWWDVNLHATPGLAGFEESRQIKVSQYHRYIFEAPRDAKVVASNDWWGSQAYLWKNQVLGFQFHPERDNPGNHCVATERELPNEGKTQCRTEILTLGQQHQPQTDQWFRKVLNGFFKVA